MNGMNLGCIKMLLKVQVKPNARKSEILGEANDYLKVAIAAPAQDGKANAELIRFLKKERNWQAEIIKGKTNKNKLIRIL